MSEPTPEALRAWAEWFDRLDSPYVRVDLGNVRPSASFILERLAAELERVTQPNLWLVRWNVCGDNLSKIFDSEAEAKRFAMETGTRSITPLHNPLQRPLLPIRECSLNSEEAARQIHEELLRQVAEGPALFTRQWLEEVISRVAIGSEDGLPLTPVLDVIAAWEKG